MGRPRRADATSVSSRRPTPTSVPLRARPARVCARRGDPRGRRPPLLRGRSARLGDGSLGLDPRRDRCRVLIFALYRLRAGREGSARSLSDIADGRRILVARGRRVTEELTTPTDVVVERDDEAITRQHQRALDVVAEVRSRISRTSGHRIQAKAHHDLDEAEWLIGGLRARSTGSSSRSCSAPACRRPASSTAATGSPRSTSTSAASPPARPGALVAACAVGLVRGERPQVGSVEIGGAPCRGRPRRAGAAPTAGPRRTSTPALRRRADLRHAQRPAAGRQTVTERDAAFAPASARSRPRSRPRIPPTTSTTSTTARRGRARDGARGAHRAGTRSATPSRPWRPRRRRPPRPSPWPRARRSPSNPGQTRPRKPGVPGARPR